MRSLDVQILNCEGSIIPALFPNIEDPLPVYDTTYKEELIKKISK